MIGKTLRGHLRNQQGPTSLRLKEPAFIWKESPRVPYLFRAQREMFLQVQPTRHSEFATAVIQRELAADLGVINMVLVLQV